MNQLSEAELSAALRQAVPEPPAVPSRLDDVRRRVVHRRRLQLGGGSLATAAVVTTAVLATQHAGSPSPHTQQVGGAVTPASTPAQLRERALHLPAVAAGTRCPVSASHDYGKGAGFSSHYSAVGDGPFTLTGNGVVDVNFEHPTNDQYNGTGWPGMKVIWRQSQAYQGPVLLRGARIDGPGGLRFDHYLGADTSTDAVDADPYAAWPDLVYNTTGTVPTVLTYPSAVRVQSPGCYAVQVDGTSFSDVIVFSVTAGH
jgi:hypothetical protein